MELSNAINVTPVVNINKTLGALPDMYGAVPIVGGYFPDVLVEAGTGVVQGKAEKQETNVK